MKNIKKIINNFITDIYKIEILRTSWALIRFIYLYYFRKKIKYYINKEEKIDDHIIIDRNNKKHTVITHNMHFAEDLLNLKKTFRKFDGSKTVSISYPLKSLDFIDYDNDKILAVGPRNEGELFLLRSLGFKWKNIFAIDLLTYSDLIELGDIHNCKYEDNSFDIIICGWVLSYSNNYEKILDEMFRICKNKGVISIGFTYIPEEKDKVRKYESRKNVIESTKQIVKKYDKKIENVYFDFDAKTLYPKEKRHSIIILRINKNNE